MTVGRTSDQRLDDLDDFFLLAAWQLGDFGERLPQPAAGRGRATRFAFAQKFLDGDAQSFGDWSQHVGTRNLPAAFPIADVRVRLADLLGQFAHGQSGGFPQLPQVGFGCHEPSIGRERKNSLHVDNILSINGQCNHA